jgi:hypothetical protein
MDANRKREWTRIYANKISHKGTKTQRGVAAKRRKKRVRGERQVS